MALLPAFKPSQVALVEEQMTVTFVDRSQPEIVVPLRKKTVVRQAPNGGDGEFLVDKHCFKGSALEMHDWIDAISTVAQRSKNRRSGTVEPGAADHEPVDATSSDDGEDDSSSSSASGTRRRKTQVTRRRQVHGSIADAAAADDGAPKRAADKRRSLTHSQATVIGEGAVAAAGNDATTTTTRSRARRPTTTARRRRRRQFRARAPSSRSASRTAAICCCSKRRCISRCRKSRGSRGAPCSPRATSRSLTAAPPRRASATRCSSARQRAGDARRRWPWWRQWRHQLVRRVQQHNAAVSSGAGNLSASAFSSTIVGGGNKRQ
jgi:hypothetical protein